MGDARHQTIENKNWTVAMQGTPDYDWTVAMQGTGLWINGVTKYTRHQSSRLGALRGIFNLG